MGYRVTRRKTERRRNRTTTVVVVIRRKTAKQAHQTRRIEQSWSIAPPMNRQVELLSATRTHPRNPASSMAMGLAPRVQSTSRIAMLRKRSNRLMTSSSRVATGTSPTAAASIRMERARRMEEESSRMERTSGVVPTRSRLTRRRYPQRRRLAGCWINRRPNLPQWLLQTDGRLLIISTLSDYFFFVLFFVVLLIYLVLNSITNNNVFLSLSGMSL